MSVADVIHRAAQPSPKKSAVAAGRTDQAATNPGAPRQAPINICPVEKIGREIASLAQAEERSSTYSSKSWKDAEHRFGLRLAKDDLLALRSTLGDMASYRQPRSMLGALTLVVLANEDVSGIIEAPDMNEADAAAAFREIRGFALRARRCLFSLATFLEEASGERRETVGGPDAMYRGHDPHALRELIVAGRMDEAVTLDDTGVAGPNPSALGSAPDPLLDLMRRTQEGGRRRGLSDDEIDELWRPLHDEQKAAAPATTFEGVLAALRWVVPEIAGFDECCDGVLRAALGGLEDLLGEPRTSAEKLMPIGTGRKGQSAGGAA